MNSNVFLIKKGSSVNTVVNITASADKTHYETLGKLWKCLRQGKSVSMKPAIIIKLYHGLVLFNYSKTRIVLSLFG